MFIIINEVPLWSCSYDSWVYIYMCIQCLSPLRMWIRIPFIAMWTRCNIMQ